jgi:cation diffusion facilitator family transporter
VNNSSPSDNLSTKQQARFDAAQKVTWVSVAVNVVLTLLQIVVGWFGRSQALIADGLHSLSDLLADFLVLFANRHGSRDADASHPYGHARIETATTFILGAMLVAVGVALLWGGATRLQSTGILQKVHPATLWIALLTLAGKEILFRYMMAVAKRLRSQMLMANAWHARSDAASSLVVAAGIGGNLLGFTFLDLIAAVIVAFMIAHMGWKMAWRAMSDLIDTSLDEETVKAIHQTALDTAGVRGLHDLKTRKMGDQALVDAHVLVDPKISVSEGHYIAEAVRANLLKQHGVLDVMVHIDPEEDAHSKPNIHLPGRKELLAHLEQRLGMVYPPPEKVVLHYLGGKVEAEIFLTAEFNIHPEKLNVLKSSIDEMLVHDPYFRTLHLHRHSAP